MTRSGSDVDTTALAELNCEIAVRESELATLRRARVVLEASVAKSENEASSAQPGDQWSAA